MARLASSPNALQPRPVVVLPSYSEQSQLIWATASTARSPAEPRQEMSPTHRSHGVSSSSPTAFSTAYSQTWHLYLCAYTAKDVPVQGRGKGGGSGIRLWELSVWQLRLEGLRLLGGMWFFWVAFTPLSLVAQVQAGKAEPH